MGCSKLESERTRSQTLNLIRRAFFKSNKRQIIMKSERFKNSAVLLLAAIVAGCSQIAVVSEKPPARFQASPGTNQAIAQTIDRAQALDRSQPQAALDAWTKPVQVGANNKLTLTGKRDPSKPEQNPALYDLIPTDQLRYHGTY